MPHTIKMYNFPMSPPCRSVRMLAKILDIDLKLVDVDLFNKEHRKPWFRKINPNTLVPAIDDEGFILGESVAIMRYMVTQYAPDQTLYPTETKQRAILDMMLDFSAADMFRSLTSYLKDVMFSAQPPNVEKREEFNEKVIAMEEFLKRSPYAAGDHMTIADLSILPNLDFAEITMEHDFSQFPKVEAWMKKLKKEIPDYEEINVKPLKMIKETHEYKKN